MEVWEEHDVLFHYTTQSGLKGILGTQALHATHYMYMNDATEMFQIKPKLVQIILPITTKLFEELAATNQKVREKIDADGGINALAQHDASRIADAVYRVTFGLDGGTKYFQPFVLSFCGHKEEYERKNGLLSQWRAYGKDSGYAIVFDTKALADLLKGENDRYLYDFWAMGDITYDGDDDAFNKEFKGLIDAINLDVPKFFKNDKGPYEALNLHFMSSAPRYKHRGFFEEREVRLVVSPTDDAGIAMLKASGNFDKLKHKAKKAVKFKETLAPYIELFDEPKIKLPIKRIIVGPHPDKASRLNKLTNYLDLSGLKIDVSCSETPLVSS